ncbi:MAG: ABC transporter ATP-binding protein [Spirochaetia bacterium]|jgi:multiple sugar transport system ATP-binding protein|nr:ABC transporter ATP-binding protein [Spirochaetia bacterium]
MANKVKIKIENLSKVWGDVRAIDNVSMEIEDRSFLTLLGPSGCGKTTTLRAIAGLEEPSNGKIYINDKLVFSKKDEIVVEPVKRNIGLIFQSYALWPHMTVYDNIAFGLIMKKLPKDEISKSVNAMLKNVRLDKLGLRFPNELSGGQQQRVAIARMLITEPSIFLMDEPLSNLDAKLRMGMRSEVKKLHQESGATTVYVTHDQEEAMTMSTHICVMKDGVIRQMDSPEMLYKKPADLFVADFISNPKMNFYDGVIEREDGKTFVVFAGFKIKVDSDLAGERKEVKVAVRPEDYILDPNGSDFRVVTQLPTGPAQILNLERDDESATMVSPDYIRVNPGEKIKIGIKEGTYNLFDKETEKRIF